MGNVELNTTSEIATVVRVSYDDNITEECQPKQCAKGLDMVEGSR
jgi:hypothetical protein